ncbi:hypothetical protein F909_02619 [Acinetobacter sp. ANC 3929]|uniref:DUF559 domain-containing protein n=1 Tax=unclassified Acinetobacter TaxID=196816 RepID=UPI0002CDDF51|nr:MULTISPECIES: DUF559 domain-containing protein [unclassified Acinetobacter]ENW81328.1 hypothetical protein F909_02619 [Acinetobacter sp. ANC 3929]MCH7353826.1 endonuclease domain-containing protein [Acinetobacter sp. NIPH 2023]MCH7354368.1 endonuclease domain-containing protein [Acinetobacter sp. NIPH 1958]MCH7361155.1 endonuclease domain-containing protein [Acinetobacter sp. NIPH 2024]
MRLSIAEYKSLIKPKASRKSKPRVKPKQQEPSEGELILMRDLRALSIGFEHEYKFHQTRKWRADFLISNTKILIEVEGGIWSQGRHTRGTGYIGDMEKYNAAAILGFQVLRFSTQQVKSGLAVQQIEQLVRGTK